MTTTPQPFYAGETNLLNPDNHVLVLIDHQPAQVAVTGSHDRTLLINNVVGLAKFAKIFGIPTLLTTVAEALGESCSSRSRTSSLTRCRSTAPPRTRGRIPE